MHDDNTILLQLGALAHPHRLATFKLLIVAGPSGVTAGDIARELGIAATALSFHLKELDRAGLIRAWRAGRYIRSAVEVDAVRRLIGYLVDDCCGGRPELCGDAIASACSCSAGPSNSKSRPRKTRVKS